MLSFGEPSSDWPLTTGGYSKKLSIGHYRRSVSMPSESLSDCSSDSDRSSPVEDIKVEEVFIPEPKFELVKKIATSNEEKKKIRREMAKSLKNEVDIESTEPFCDGSESKKNEKKIKKKKKMKKMDLGELGFITSLLPRPSKPPNMNDEEIHKVLERIDIEYLELEERMSPFENLEKLEGNRIENRYVRLDRDRKVRKAHKQVKDKYCLSVRNNDGRKKLYIHHRVMRLMQLEAARAHLHYPTPPKKNQPDNYYLRLAASSSSYSATQRVAPVQNLAHALHQNGTAAGDIPTDLISLLISLQHRDISPEDYDTLLRLDESVAPKTVTENALKSFKTDTVDESSAGEVCAVCLEPYSVGQSRKFLPCDHVFHGDCIDMWLKNSSMNCPLDGLPVDS